MRIQKIKNMLIIYLVLAFGWRSILFIFFIFGDEKKFLNFLLQFLGPNYTLLLIIIEQNIILTKSSVNRKTLVLRISVSNLKSVEDPYFSVFLPSLYYIMYQYIRLVTMYSHQLSGFSTNWDFPRLSTNTYSSRFYENTLPNKKLNFSLMSLLTFFKTSINTGNCVYSTRTLRTTEVDGNSVRTSSNVYNRYSINDSSVVLYFEYKLYTLFFNFVISTFTEETVIHHI